jgi:hypothetical protein
MALVLRRTKGSKLTIADLDGNFEYVEGLVATRQLMETITYSDIEAARDVSADIVEIILEDYVLGLTINGLFLNESITLDTGYVGDLNKSLTVWKRNDDIVISIITEDDQTLTAGEIEVYALVVS